MEKGAQSVLCLVSERWLKIERADFKDFISIEVMTSGGSEKHKKICSLIISEKELKTALKEGG